MNAVKWTSILLLALVGSSCGLVRTSVSPREELAPASRPATFDHDDFDAVLRRHVDERGLVRWADLAAEPTDLERYYAKVAAFSPDSDPELFPTEASRLAYWLNAYNAAVMATVLRHYPIGSVDDVEPPWLLFWMPEHSGFFVLQGPMFGGIETSLYYVENSVIRERFADARIHFALNCASLGCPRLPRSVFTAEQLDQQLATEARRFCADERNFKIDDDARKIVLSPIFQWYESDFIGDHQRRGGVAGVGILDAIAEYLSAPARERLNAARDYYGVEYSGYDWNLNDAAPVATGSS